MEEKAKGKGSLKKKCPHCGESILISAKKCKHCGAVLVAPQVEETPEVVASTPEPVVEVPVTAPEPIEEPKVTAPIEEPKTEPVVEPVSVPEPEPVKEEVAAAPVEEEKPLEQEVTLEPAPAPTLEPEPVKEPEPAPVVEQSAPKVEEKVAPAAEPKPQPAPKAEEKPKVADNKPKKRSKAWIWILTLLIVLGGAAAYLFVEPDDYDDKDWDEETEEIIEIETNEEVATLEEIVVPEENIEEEVSTEDVQIVEEAEAVQAPPEEVAVEIVQPAVEEEPMPIAVEPKKETKTPIKQKNAVPVKQENVQKTTQTESKTVEQPKVQAQPNVEPQKAISLRVNNKTELSHIAPATGEVVMFYVSTNASEWKVANLPSWCTLSNQTATSFSIACNENSSPTPRAATIMVMTTEGNQAVAIALQQGGKIAPYIQVNSLNTITKKYDAYRHTETFHVSSNAPWTIVMAPAWCTISQKTDNSFVMTCRENTSFVPRSDSFLVKTTDGSEKSVKIEINQAAKKRTASTNYNPTDGGIAVYNPNVANTTPAITGSISKVWVEYNVVEKGETGMRIHVKFNINNMNGQIGHVIAFFDHQDGQALNSRDGQYETTGKTVCLYGKFKPSYDNSAYDDYPLFIPYTELHGTGDLRFLIGIRKDKLDPGCITASNFVHFSLSY